MTAAKSNKKITRRPVLVTTEHKGVFFGYLDSQKGTTVKLKGARCCVYWTAENRGFMGLASHGPTSGARVGPAVDIELMGVTSVSDCTPMAVESWEKAPWA